MKSHKDEKFECDLCDEIYNNPDSLKRHVKSKHNNLSEEEVKKFTCEECGKQLRSSNSLKKHMVSHTDDTPFACDICDKSFKLKEYLRLGYTSYNLYEISLNHRNFNFAKWMSIIYW